MASGTLNKMRDQKKRKSCETFTNKVRISVPQPDDKADTRKHQTEIGTPPSSQNLDGLEVGNYSFIHFNSDCFLFELSFHF